MRLCVNMTKNTTSLRLTQLAFLWFWDTSVYNCPRLSKSSESNSTSDRTQLCPSNVNASACAMCLFLSADQHRS